MKRFLLLLSILALPVLGAGLNDGSSWADAWTNLASVTWTRGDTYYIAGGTYNENVSISTADTGVWIILKKANAVDNGSDIGWDASFASEQAVITAASSSYIFRPLTGHFEIDGVTGTGTNGHGIKLVNTLNDGVTQPGPIIYMGANQSSFHIHHVECAGTGYHIQEKGGDGIYNSNSANTSKGLHISDCWIHGVDRNGVTWGGLVGTSYTDFGALFENNVIEETGGSFNLSWHGQAMQLSYALQEQYIIIRNNLIRNTAGSGMLVLMGGTGAMHQDMRIYNNVFTITDTDKWGTNSPGVINRLSGLTPMTNVLIANNTFFNIQAHANLARIFMYDTTALNVQLQNNLWENCLFTSDHTGVDEQNNGYYNNNGAGVPSGTPGQVNGSSTTFLNPSGGDFHMLSTGYAVDAGIDQSAVFTTDKDGNPRVGTFDIGAYEYPGILGWWKFDDGAGTTAVDSSGNGLDGTLTSGPTWVSGKVGPYAVAFDGDNDVVIVPYDASFNFTGDFTVTAWVYSTQDARKSAVGRWVLNLWNGWCLEQITPTRFDFEYQDRTISGEGAHRSIGSGLGYTTGAWHHVAGVKSGDYVYVFVDGNVGTTSTQITNSIALTTEGIAIGARKNQTPDNLWQGSIDDVRLYNRALTQAEILALYNGSPAGTVPHGSFRKIVLRGKSRL